MPKIVVEQLIDEGSSFDIRMIIFKGDDRTTPIIPDSVKVFIIAPFATPIYVNGRDGTANAGLIVAGNQIDFHMGTADTTLIDRPKHCIDGYEERIVRFEVTYNGGADKHFEEFYIKIRDMEHIGE